ncbi:helix-turn-helix domain-containing protein [Methanosarcina barkeri]|uniref:helix-turn-helix domain-containing protein n=1 Tax=Methanosarcina barkeri TaxID=2208 RepID=UPI000A8E16A9|nr:helix-turn-helix domain-containing protein [Methanosarcina barkeri]
MVLQTNLQLIRNLEKLGLTENEAKTYIGLVSLREATAREIHELTNVPRAKIYEILKVLAKKRLSGSETGISNVFPSS